MTIWENFLESSIQAPGARAISAENKGTTDYLASSVADFVKKLFVGTSRLRRDDETSIVAVAEKVKAQMRD